MEKVLGGYVARLSAVEELLAKLGDPTDEKRIGLTPKDNPVDEPTNTFIDELNRKRMGN